MPEKYKDILMSLLPLLLIIFVSWFFSFLGNRLKKQAGEQPEAVNGRQPQGLKDIFFMDDGPEEPAQKTPQIPPQTGPQGPGIGGPWRPNLTGPKVTPDPIKPKWWGA